MAMHMDAMQRWAETPEPFAKPQKTVCRDAHHADTASLLWHFAQTN